MSDTYTFPVVVSQAFNINSQNRNNIISIALSQRLSLQDAETTLVQANLYYSWYNIRAAYGNNVMAYAWPVDKTGPVEWEFFQVGVPPITGQGTGVADGGATIPDGTYSYDQLNTILQDQMIADGNYPAAVAQPAGTPTTFLSFGASVNQYAVEITATPIPVGATVQRNPSSPSHSNYVWDNTGCVPLLLFNPSPFGAGIPGLTPGVIPTTASVSSFSRLLGYPLITAGNMVGYWANAVTMLWTSYPLGGGQGNARPSTQATIVANSPFPPRIDVVDVVNINTNLVNSQYVNNYSNVIYSFSPHNIAWGSTISITPTVPSWVTIADGSYDFIQVTLTDDNNNLLPNIDPQWSATLLIRQKVR